MCACIIEYPRECAYAQFAGEISPTVYNAPKYRYGEHALRRERVEGRGSNLSPLKETRKRRKRDRERRKRREGRERERERGLVAVDLFVYRMCAGDAFERPVRGGLEREIKGEEGKGRAKG